MFKSVLVVLFSVTIFWSAAAMAGDYHVAVFPAKVIDLRQVDQYELSPFPRSVPRGEKWVPLSKHSFSRKACEITLQVRAGFKPIDTAKHAVYVKPKICSTFKKDEKVKVQYYGLADDFRFVSLKIRGSWHSLSWMRVSGDKDMTTCLTGKVSSSGRYRECSHIKGGTRKLEKHKVILVRDAVLGVRYDKRISAETALALYRFLQGTAHGKAKIIHVVPKVKDRFLVTAAGKDNGGSASNYGLRLVLVESSGSGFKEIGHSQSAGDSYNLEPNLFVGPTETLVLAEMGTEYSWGFMVTVISKQGLVLLAGLDVSALPTPPYAEDCPSAIKYARVIRVEGQWRIEFDCDVIIDCGGRRQRRVKRQNRQPIAFSYNGKQFILSK